jgi:hypothetical protein
MKHKNDSINDEVMAFLAAGGEMLVLRDGTKAEQREAARIHYHREKAIEGDGRSAAIVARAEKKKNTVMIF